MAKTIIKIDDLDVSVESKRVLNSVSIEISEREINVVIGPNGAGKSSLANTLAGHPKYVIDGGSIEFNGENLVNLKVEERSQKGLFVAFQDPCAIDGVTVANFLRTTLRSHVNNPISKCSASDFYNKIYELLDFVGLQRDFTGRQLNKGFSGGEKKRMELLQMLLFRPKFVIFDEIDSGLDIDALKIVFKSIDILKESVNTCFLIITHSIDFVEQLNPSKIHLLSDGKIKESGCEDVLKRVRKEGYA